MPSARNAGATCGCTSWPRPPAQPTVKGAPDGASGCSRSCDCGQTPRKRSSASLQSSAPMQLQPLAPYGWSDRWAALLADHPGCDPARVVRHDGSGLLLATADGIVAAPLTRRLDPAPTVGDWIACEGDEPVAVLERSSLLTRRAAEGDISQALAANVDLVLLVCGLDR